MGPFALLLSLCSSKVDLSLWSVFSSAQMYSILEIWTNYRDATWRLPKSSKFNADFNENGL